LLICAYHFIMQRKTAIGYVKIAMFAVAIGLVYISCAPDFSGSSSPLVGKPATDFSLQSVDGRTVKYSDFKGSVVVLDFWATWCPPCRESLPNLNRLSNDPALAKRGLKVLAVDSGETIDTVRSFLDANHYSLPVALDTDGSTGRLYRVDGFPTTVLIGRDGLVKNVFVGFAPEVSEKELSSAINKALAE
jgi:peroxiredoxin